MVSAGMLTALTADRPGLANAGCNVSQKPKIKLRMITRMLLSLIHQESYIPRSRLQAA